MPGQWIRIQVTPGGSTKMLASMKDHRGSVNSIMVSPKTGAEAISASSDGCCIIWDLETNKRRTSFLSNTFFKSVAYHPDEVCGLEDLEQAAMIVHRAWKNDAMLLLQPDHVQGHFLS
jgi:WD40 repeat protein